MYSGLVLLGIRGRCRVPGEPQQHPQPAGACHLADDAVENAELVIDDELASAFAQLVVVPRENVK